MFQSTHSLRSATYYEGAGLYAYIVSIHALLAECDFFVHRYYLTPAVSIHALLAECDFPGLSLHLSPACFNPRTPCGVRPGRACAIVSANSFNPRTPCGVRRLRVVPLQPCNGFQSTHSLRSATVSASRMRDRTPVSIHALLAECDATDFIHYYSTEQIILCANLPKKTVIARLHFLSIYLSIFYSQCITPIADLPGNSCELEVGAQAMFHSL